MRWASYVSPDDGGERCGLVRGELIYGMPASTRLVDLLSRGRQGLEEAAESLRATGPAELVEQPAVGLLPPVPAPPSVRDFMSFEEHVVTSLAAQGLQLHPNWYDNPTFYFSNPAAVQGAYDPVAISPGTTAFDYELEVAVVIGKPGANIAVEDAAEHIAGYTLLCDWSARDLQEREVQIGLGPAKGKDGATSVGPHLVTPDEIAHLRNGNGYDLSMVAAVNGQDYSRGSWADMYWSFEEMVSYASRGTRLVTGDVLGSGTVGTGCILELSRMHGHERFPWLKVGDRVELTVEHLGTISSVVVAGAEVTPLRGYRSDRALHSA